MTLCSTVPVVLFANRFYFFGNVYGDRAPGDTTTTTHAPAGPELVDPGGQLVSQPLPVAGSWTGPDASAVDIRELHIETRVPPLDALRPIAGEIGGVFDAAAEAGGTNHRTVGAVEASRRDLVPAGVLVIGEQ